LNTDTFPVASLWSMGLFLGGALAVVLLMLSVSYVLGERHRGRVTDEPYESGMPPTGIAGATTAVRYYIVAMAFVIFDVEALFVIAWAVSVRELGWAGYVEAVVFIGVLLAALAYLLRLGALNWGSGRQGNRAGGTERP
jgi:NADH-quinone oxidoreductase subunit A